MPTRPVALLALIASALFAQDQPPLMPWPANVTIQQGAVPIDSNFTISISGAGASDPRVQDAVQRMFARLSRQTGVPTFPHIVPSGGNPTLNIVVERKDHAAPQRLGDDERYALTAANGHVRISADAPLGALRGIETFLQLVQQNINATSASPSTPGFSIADVTIRDEPRFESRPVARRIAPLYPHRRS
jgi:hexosaminidase